MVQIPTTTPCSTMIDVLETGEKAILFSLSFEKLWYVNELDPKIQIYMSSLWVVLISRRLLHNGTYCVGPDEPCISANDQVA